ncbi:MAG: DUF2284 domain-containing protein [Candidatus Hodarchaeota archaeon]
MINKEELEKNFVKNGFNDYKWIDTEKIVVSYWVRMKCMYGCPEYGRKASCPPNVPSVHDSKKFILDYKKAVIFHFAKAFSNPEDRHEWTKKIDLDLLRLEKDIFLAGYVKVFLLLIASCQLCQECTEKRETCKYPKKSRPTPEALGIDVFSTVKQVNYPIEVLRDPTEKMNRYAILLID